MIRNAEYWKKRSELLMRAAHDQADRSIADIETMYRDAEHRVVQEIERWYARFAENNQITLAEARKLLNSRQLEEFRWTVERYIKEASKANISPEFMKKLENASAKYHVSRLESVQLGIQQEIDRLYGNQLDQVDTLLRDIVSDGYTRQCYEIQKGIGIGWDVAKLNQNTLDNLLARPWTADGRTFSQRIWGARDTLIGDLQSELIQGILRGDGPQRITDRVQKRFGVSRRQAGRLVHTETTYFHAVADKESYKELGVDEVEILETLDSHTCEICAPLDGTKLPRSQMEPGVTVPPFHPNCRGTTVPVIDEEIWGVGERAARDEDGKVYTVPGDMTYEEWKKTFVKSPTPKGVDVTDEYKKTARPGKGQIVVEEGAEKEDVNMAHLLHKFFGGDITVLRPINKQNQKTPDFRWNGKLWDLKTVSTEKAANTAIQRGLKQIRKNPGGIVLDYGDREFANELLLHIIEKRMQWCHLDSVDILILSNGQVRQILRYKK